MPSPMGEGGSRRLTDEAFFPPVEVLQKAMRYSSSTATRSPFSGRRRRRVRRREVGGRGYALLIHRYAVPLLPQEKAKGGRNLPPAAALSGLSDKARKRLFTFQQRLVFRLRHRPTEIVALHPMTAERAEHIRLLFCFHARGGSVGAIRQGTEVAFYFSAMPRIPPPASGG